MLFRFERIVLFLVFSLAYWGLFAQAIEKDYLVRQKLYTTVDGLVSRDVYCAVQDDLGFIWFGTKYGLNRFDGYECLLLTTADGLHSNVITNLVKGEFNKLFIEYGDQWQPFDIENRVDVLDCSERKIVGTITKETVCEYNSIPQEVLNNLNEGRNWRIQSISLSDLCGRFDVTEETARLYQSSNCVGKLLVTRNRGVYYLEGDLEYRVIESEDFYSEGNTTVNSFFKDVQGNIWICVEKGVYRINIRKKMFRSFFTSDELSEHKIPQARGISVSGSNASPKVKAVLLNALISAESDLTFVRKNGLSWGLLEYGGHVYYAVNGKFIEAEPGSFREKRSCELASISERMVNCIFPLNDSLFLLGRGRDIICVNRRSFQNVIIPRKSNSIIPEVKNVYRFINSSKGLLAVAENGLFVVSNNCITDYYGPETSVIDRNLPVTYILDACEDEAKVLWIGTNGQGLVKWDWSRRGAPLVKYSMSQGLPSLIVYRLELDAFKNIWASTDDGIFSLSPYSNVVRVFRIEDGLPSNEFNRTSSFKSENGDLYFGSVNGVMGFSPSDFFGEQHSASAPLRLISITKRNKGSDSETDVLKDLLSEGKVVWTNSDYLFEICFALLDFRGYGVKYFYRIPGVVNEWTALERNVLTLGSLPQGFFNVEVRAQLENGELVEQDLVIPIEVIPPFYLRASFILSSIGFVIAIVSLIIWLRGRKLKKLNIKLERLVRERTDDLMKNLEVKDILLKELHHRVKNNLQTIISLLDLQKEQLKDSSAIEALSVSQSRLSSIALVHENFYNTSNLKDISFGSFLRDLASSIQISFGKNEGEVELKLITNDICIDIVSAIPLGLVLNELLTNSFKHIDVEYYPLKIAIELVEINSYEYVLRYSDNGQGLPSEVVLESPGTLGLKLVRGLTSQLKGNLNYSKESGSRFVIRFPKNRNSLK